MKIRYIALILGLLLTGCSFVGRKMAVQNALIDRPDLAGLTEEDVTVRFGLPQNIIPVESGHDQDETWVYRDKWYGVMTVRIVDGEVSNVSYQYGMLSR